jgi:hypothetical protein
VLLSSSLLQCRFQNLIRVLSKLIFKGQNFSTSCACFCCSKNDICIVSILCGVSFIACVVLCAVFCLSDVLVFVMCVICVLCLIVVSLPPG